ncbi:MAG: transmembrane domain-containing protein [Clostridiales bacterium]|nr:transmembrane domain-containing protein [Clostridiales bacterium]
MTATFLSGSIFTPAQVAAMIVVGVIIGLLIIANVVIFVIYRRKQERKLCTSQLQNKRLELLNHLNNITDDGSLVEGAPVMPTQTDDDEAEEEMTDDEDAADDDVDDDDAVSAEAPLAEGEDVTQNEILAVADMSEYTRRKLGYLDEEFDRKRYYVRYTLGFDAKLRAADAEVKARYNELIADFKQFKGVKVKTSFRQQRIYKGRKTLALLLFRGKTLCVAFALDPKDYAETKYRGIDKSDKKRFEKTPLLYKLTSERRMEYAKYLVLQLADVNVMVLDEKPDVTPVDLSECTPDELYVAGALRITVLGEAPELEPEPEPELTVEDTVDGEAVTDGGDKEEETDDDIEFDTPEGRMVFDRSFTARIIQADDALKARYSELKNYILGYKGVKNRISWRRETYSIGRKTVATFAVRGKTLCLYLAADPTRFEDSKYNVENMSETASRRKTPLLFRIKNDRRTAYAKQLIDIVMQEHGAAKTERRPVDYTSPYRSNDVLVKRGLIRISQTTAKNPFGTTDKK